MSFALKLDEERCALDEEVAVCDPVATEESYLAIASEVLHLHHTIGVASLCLTRAHLCDYASDGYFLQFGEFLSLVIQFVQLSVAHVVEHHRIFVERMGREVYAHKLTLLVEAFEVAPFEGALGQRRMDDGNVHGSEERVLVAELILLIAVAIAHEDIKEDLRTLACRLEEKFALDVRQTVESTRDDQVFDILAVACRQVDALEEVEDRLVRSASFPLVYDSLHGGLAHTLDSSHTETYLALGVDAELVARLIDVRSESAHAHLLAFVPELAYVRYVVERAAHDGRHELSREVSLEISRLVCHPRVARGVRLIEGIGSELLPVCPYLVENLRVMVVLLSTFDELRLHGVNDSLLLLTHGLAERIALASREVSELS